MGPLKSDENSNLPQKFEQTKIQSKPPEKEPEVLEPLKLVWKNVFLFIYLHLAALYGAYLLFSGSLAYQTILWSFFISSLNGLGITAGAHRYFAHRSYKASVPLQLILAFMQTLAGQNSIHEWCRDHRVHHKFSETNADPHNVKRGFFFAHMGWLIYRKPQDVKIKGKTVDMSDLEANPIVMFQKKYYMPLVLLISFVFPTIVPWAFWGESFFNSWMISQFRYCTALHVTWLVNSAAHLWGDHPYDKNINPAENKVVAILAFGEGWHNFHHVFPWDYKTSEFGEYRTNLAAAFIDFMAWIGWAWDLKTVPKNVVEARAARTGDGTRMRSNEEGLHHEGPWGWGDETIKAEDIAQTIILKSKKA